MNAPLALTYTLTDCQNWCAAAKAEYCEYTSGSCTTNGGYNVCGHWLGKCEDYLATTNFCVYEHYKFGTCNDHF